jgi:type I restriction enzyme, S subunit
MLNMIFNSSKYNAEWNIKSLNQLGKFHRGKSTHRPRNDKELFAGGGYPLVQTGQVKKANLYLTEHAQEYSEFGLAQSKLWEKNTLCITIAANIAETSLLAYPMCFPDSVVGFNAYEDESSELFMHYVFTYIRKAIQNSTSGSIQDNINLDYLLGLKFRVPNKEYQDKINSILSSIDLKIELNERLSKELENKCSTIFEYWFLQYNFPSIENKPYQISGGTLKYDNIIMRDLPNYWNVCKLSDVESNIVTGKTPSKKVSDYFNGQIPFVTIGDIRGNMHITTTEETLTVAGANTQKNKYLPENSICVTCIASPGLVGITTAECQTNQQINSIIPRTVLYKNYLYFYLGKYFKSAKAKAGNTFANMSKGEFSDILLVKPDEATLSKFNETVDPSIMMIKELSLQTNELLRIRNWLMPMLMTGQATVSC